MKKLWLAALTLAVAGSMAASAAPMRTLLVKEGMTPGKGKLELGSLFVYQEITADDSEMADSSYGELMPYARLGLTDDFSVNVGVPLAHSDMGDDDTFGVGDLTLGVDLVGFRDTLGYPYVMPYVRLSLPTGDDEEGLGAGETQVKLGASIGTTVDDDWDFVADVGFVGRSETDNALQVGGAIIYSFNKKFSMQGEVMYEASSDSDMEDSTVLLGGMIYRPAEGWLVGLYGGMQTGEIDDNVIGGAKLAYAFE